MELLDTLWNEWLLFPLHLLHKHLDVDLYAGYGPIVARLIVIGAILFVLFEIYSRVKKWRQRRNWLEDMVEVGEAGAHEVKDKQFAEVIEGAKDLKRTVEPLKKAKQYDRVAQVYASVNRHKDAAKWFRKAKMRKQAAEEWARAGKTVKAAKILMKEGDYATAARFFEEGGKHRPAAQAYMKAGDLPCAASAYANAGSYEDAVRLFADYFAAAQDPPEAQLRAAEACYAMLQNAGAKTNIAADARRGLMAAVATRFEQAKRWDLAARLYYEANEKARAGGIFARQGKLEEAARCMREAGKTKEANLIGAQFYEKRGRWKEAAMSYAGGGEFRRAGDCFGKAGDKERSAECYSKAGEYYGAALAYAHLRRFDEAIKLLQKIDVSHKTFDLSRALLGRCFYEMHDFEHCAATLENHLTNERVEKGNVEYWYMLALALEQLGKLRKSQDILFKIRSVDVGFRDVAQRISSISSRISLGAELSGAGLVPGAVQASGGDAEMMGQVENLLGGRYRLDRELGRGGMGTVYLAKDTQLDRPVALKFLGSLVDGSEEYRQRFIREAKAAARVNHPNIIAIYDISAGMGKAYIAMEYVEGPNLHQYVEAKERLSPREAVNLIAQACSALEAIHSAGIIHRDIKPDNILIAKGSVVKLTDFGLAKALDARITATNVVMGTPAYMSPEQTQDSDVDARSDIYSLGLVLHEALTGTCVFKDGDVMLRQQQELPPPPSKLVDGVPAPLDRIVMTCVAKEPAARFQTAEQLSAALRDVKD